MGLDRQSACVPWRQALIIAVRVWVGAFAESVIPLVVIITFMWLYYIPARVVTKNILAKVLRPLLYESIRNLLSIISFWLSTSMIAIDIFSFQYAIRGLSLTILPGFILDLVISNVRCINTAPFFTTLRNILVLFAIGLGFFLIQRTDTRHLDQVAFDESSYRLTKDGTPMALLKGLVGMYLMIVFFLYNIFPFYPGYSIGVKLLFRFIIFPSAFLASKWYQNSVILSLPRAQLDRRMTINRMCCFYMQFYARVFLSNLSDTGARSLIYLLVNAAGAAMEIIRAMTHEFNLRLVFRCRQQILSLHHHTKAFIYVRFRLAKVSPFSAIPTPPTESENPNEQENSEESEESYVASSMMFHSMNLSHELTAETYAVFLAPLSMYFLFPIFSSSQFRTISSIGECISQIAIQLIFEFAGDVLSIAYKIRRNRIYLDEQTPRPRPTNMAILIPFMICCLLVMQRFVQIFSS